jgi:putative PIN family toxin of toxin-antitoxin system
MSNGTVSETKTLRVMADANVLFSAYGWPRFPFEVLQHAVNKDYQLVLSPAIINEAYQALREYFGETQARNFLTFLADTNYEEVETPSIENIAANMSLIRDPKDVHVALAAINAKVDYLLDFR